MRKLENEHSSLTMKKSALFVFVFRFFFQMTFDSVSANEIVFLSLEYPPYSSRHMPQNGAIIEVLSESLKTSNWSLKIDYVPWKRVPHLISEGAASGALPLWPNEVAHFRLLSTRPIFISQLGFFVRSIDAATIDVNLSNMSGKKVCTVDGYGYPKNLLSSGILRDDASSDESNLKRLFYNGRCDYVALERAVGMYILSKNSHWAKNYSAVWKGPAFSELPLTIGIDSKQAFSKELIEWIDSGVEKMRKNGMLAEIARKHEIELTP